MFAALNSTPLSKVKAVILGQDPYFNENQVCHSQAWPLLLTLVRLMAFASQSERASRPLLPSLACTRCLKRPFLGLNVPDMAACRTGPIRGSSSSMPRATHILPLFTHLRFSLTVEDGKPNSHSAFGWQRFTDYVIKVLLENRSNLVFILWGGFAQKKGAAISPEKHCVLSGPHPSPMSGNVFLECTHFADCNRYLSQHGITPIDWRLKE